METSVPEKLRYRLTYRQSLKVGDVVALASFGRLFLHYVIENEGVYSPPPYCDDVIQFECSKAENYKHKNDFIMHSDDVVAVLDPAQRDLVVWSKERADAEFKAWCDKSFGENASPDDEEEEDDGV